MGLEWSLQGYSIIEPCCAVPRESTDEGKVFHVPQASIIEPCRAVPRGSTDKGKCSTSIDITTGASDVSNS